MYILSMCILYFFKGTRTLITNPIKPHAIERVYTITFGMPPYIGTRIFLLIFFFEKLTKKNVIVNVEEVKIPELDAQLVAENICDQLERRTSFRTIFY